MGQNVKDFIVVNSFASKPFGGNPAAVFINADGLNQDIMQKIAQQVNLVETVFVLEPDETETDFVFRYFTPLEELPVAGHPTVAAILALIECKRINIQNQDSLVIKTGAGKQQVYIKKEDQPLVIMNQPKPRYLPIVADRKEVAHTLGINVEDLLPDLPIQPVDTGLGHLIVPVKSLDVLMQVERKIDLLREICKKHGVREAQVFTFETYESYCDLHTRNICPREGIEDPGCGMGNGALAAYLAKHYSKGSLNMKVEQGYAVNMPCVINIFAVNGEDGVDISIGGVGRIMIKGQFYI